MINSGLNVPKPAIPIPAFEVPYAAPTAVKRKPESNEIEDIKDVISRP